MCKLFGASEKIESIQNSPQKDAIERGWKEMEGKPLKDQIRFWTELSSSKDNEIQTIATVSVVFYY